MKKPMKTLVAIALMMLPMLSLATLCQTLECQKQQQMLWDKAKSVETCDKTNDSSNHCYSDRRIARERVKKAQDLQCYAQQGRLKINRLEMPQALEREDDFIVFKEGGENNLVSVDTITTQENGFRYVFSFDDKGQIKTLDRWRLSERITSAQRLIFKAEKPKKIYSFESLRRLSINEYFKLSLSELKLIKKTQDKQRIIKEIQPFMDRIKPYEILVKQINGYDYSAFQQAFAQYPDCIAYWGE